MKRPSCTIKNKQSEALRLRKWRVDHPNASKRTISHSRGLGFIPLNSCFYGAHTHHLHIENNASFCVYIPDWLHKFYRHNAKNGRGMDTINAVALDFWLSEYDFFEGLQVVRDLPPAKYNLLVDLNPPVVNGLPWGVYFEGLKGASRDPGLHG